MNPITFLLFPDKKLYILFWFFLITAFFSCKNGNHLQGVKPVIINKQTATAIGSPVNGETFKLNDTITFRIDYNSDNVKIDSVILFDRPVKAGSYVIQNYFFQWKAQNIRVGNNNLKATVYYNDSLTDIHYLNLLFLPDIVPEKYSYNVIRKYPHDPSAYTQGLVFNEGYIYEGTGLYGKSRLVKVDINTGKLMNEVNLEKNFFGEGITIFKDKVYQITYRSQTGFIYDKETFQRIRSFNYQMNEGWGLTNDGENLIMSDGTNNIYFLNPDFLTITDQIRIYDDKGIVENINEMEYINGIIYANIYMDSKIVMIDPEVGNVIAYVDLVDLYPPEYLNDSDKVLNGIAYNEDSGNLYITGKKWPFLYEIELIPYSKY